MKSIAAPHHPYEFDVPAALEHLRARDPVLAGVMDRVGPFALRISDTPTPFGMLSQALVYQQLSIKAAGTIFGRFRALFGPDVRWPTPRQVLGVDLETLRGAGLSMAKARAVTDLAEKTEQGIIPPLKSLREMRDEEVIRCLVQVRGIGRWTAEMFLIFALGRPNVLPMDDLGMRRSFQLAYGLKQLPEQRRLERQAKRWRPYCTVATWYLWEALEVTPDKG